MKATAHDVWKKSPASCLIIQTAFIGDVILATALIEKLREYHPACSIDFMLRKGNEGLLKNNPHVREVLVWNKQKSKYASLFGLWRRIVRQRYDVVVNVQRFATTGMVTAFSRAAIKMGFDKNPLSQFFTWRAPHALDGQHEVNRNQALIAPLTDETPCRPSVYPSQEDDAMVAPYKGKPYVCLAPGSVWFTKQWPAEKWSELAGLLAGRGYVVYLLGGADDRALCAGLRREGVVSLAGELNLLQAASLMRDAQMNYVNDSAPLHLASAVNASVTAIFCSTLPSFGFGPLSDSSEVIETGEGLACRPCGLHGRRQCPEGHFACAHTIAPAMVANTL